MNNPLVPDEDEDENEDDDDHLVKEEYSHQDEEEDEEDEPLEQSRPPFPSFDARPRTSKLLNHAPPRPQLRRIDHPGDSEDDVDDLNGSVDHPSLSPTSTTSIHSGYERQREPSNGIRYRYTSPRRPLNRGSELNVPDIRPTASYSESLHVHNSAATQRRLRETERRLEKVSVEYDEQIARLEVELSAMQHEIVMHQKAISDYQSQERVRLNDIAKLEKQLVDTENENEIFKQVTEEFKAELKKKTDELARVQDALHSANAKLKLVESNFDQLHQDYVSQKAARDDAADLKVRLEQEIEGSRALFAELEEMQKESKRLKQVFDEMQDNLKNNQMENKRMKQIIDEMKEDLDDARRRAVQIIPSNKQTLDDELGESTNEIDSKLVQTEHILEEAGFRVDEAQKKLQLTENQLEETEVKLGTAEKRLKQTEERLEKTEQERETYQTEARQVLEDLKKVRKLSDKLQEENHRLLDQINTLEAYRRRRTDGPAKVSETRSISVQCSHTDNMCNICGYIASAHQESIRDLTQRVHDQAETIKRVRSMNVKYNNSGMTQYITIAKHTLLNETTATARIGRTFIFFLTLYIIVQVLVSVKQLTTAVSYGIEDYPYASLYPLRTNPYASRSKFVEEVLFWLQSVLLDEEDLFVAT
ncbi:hypothetical protein BJV82DRAFT_608938 [Fennellomyces sp. T-0311]|nr:hypothetical protein BJV82DRAFT_608938 [Fennellomyces sp. T-0311]